MLVLAGLAYWGWRRLPRGAGAASVSPLGVVLLAAAVPLGVSVFWEGLKAGLLTFGGAYTAVPLLQEQAVDVHGWLTEDEFLDGLAISGILPAPLIIFSTFVGYLAGGLGTSLLMTLGVFLPAFVFPLFLHDRLVAVAADERLRPFLLGVTAAVVGLIAAVTVDLLDASVPDVPSALLALGAFAVLYVARSKLAVLWVVLGCGALRRAAPAHDPVTAAGRSARGSGIGVRRASISARRCSRNGGRISRRPSSSSGPSTVKPGSAVASS